MTNPYVTYTDDYELIDVPPSDLRSNQDEPHSLCERCNALVNPGEDERMDPEYGPYTLYVCPNCRQYVDAPAIEFILDLNLSEEEQIPF